MIHLYPIYTDVSVSHYGDPIHPDGSLQSPDHYRRRIHEFGRMTGRETAMEVTYSLDIHDPPFAFPLEQCRAIAQAGAFPLVIPMCVMVPPMAPLENSLEAIAAGSLDPVIDRWARGAADFGLPLVATFGWEVNGDWQWCGKHVADREALVDFEGSLRPKSGAAYVQAHRRWVDVVRQIAPNVTWLWMTLQNYYGEWNRSKHYFPGPGYAQWLGIGVHGWWPVWYWPRPVPFREAFDAALVEITDLPTDAADLPLFVELSCCEVAGDATFKPRWMREALAHLGSASACPRLWQAGGIVNFFDDRQSVEAAAGISVGGASTLTPPLFQLAASWPGLTPGQDVGARIDSSPESLAAVRDALRDGPCTSKLQEWAD